MAPRNTFAVGLVLAPSGAFCCDVWRSSGLEITGLMQHPEYNGAYLRDEDVFGAPSFRQRAPLQPCGTAMRKGECGAVHWQVLPAGNASESQCLKACETELHHGCCRFGPDGSDGWAAASAAKGSGSAPAGCALGHGNVVFEAVPGPSAFVTSCHGRAVVLQVDGTWRLASPRLLDLTSAQERQTSHLSIAESSANQSLTSGFQRESEQRWPPSFVDADAQIQLRCDEAPEAISQWILIVPITAAVLCLACIVGVTVCCCCSKKEPQGPREVRSPELAENPIDDWDTMLDGQGVPATSTGDPGV